MSIPREFIQLLLSRIELVDLIDERVPLRKKSSNNYFACCPFHNEKSASFSVSQNKQFYYCFGCGAHGNAIDFLLQYDRMDFPEAVESLAKRAGMEVPREARKSDKPAVSANLYELMEQVSRFYQQQLKTATPAIDYLKKRGLSGAIAKDFAIGFAPAGWDQVLQQIGKTADLKQQLFTAGMLIKKEDGGFYDRFRDRIMFPILDRRGRVIGFGGRIIDKGEPKYLNSPETPIFQKGHELYGLYQALQVNRQLTRAVIVEGYMDVIALFQYGVTYAMATLGTATTANHIQRLLRYTSEIVFCFDGDNAGRTAAWRALLVILPLMKDGIQVRFMFLPDGEDPDTLIRKEEKDGFEKRLQNAGSLSQFFFQSLATQIDLSSMDGRARFVKEAKEHLDQLPEGVFRQMMFDELGRRAQITMEPAKKPASAKPSATKARSPSTLRLALTLLIQNPSLAEQIESPLPDLDVQGWPLLREVIAFSKLNPKVSTGGLLEHWRQSEDGKIIAKLAQTEHMVPENGIVHEFTDAIKQLRKLASEHAIKQILMKANQTELSPEEKQQLHDLIQQTALVDR